MHYIGRRRFLRLSGAGAVAAGSGGLAAILASGRAPAYAQGTTLHWLKFVDFVPVSDQLLRGKITDECKKALGIDLRIETINGDGVQARISSAIQSKTGPDILMAVNNWAQLYADSVVDVSDVAEEIGKAQGGYYETAHAVANDGKKWIAVPYTILGVLMANRTSWFEPSAMARQVSSARCRSRPRQVPANLGRVPRRRQIAQAQEPALWPDSRPRLWRRTRLLVSLSVVMGRQGGRGRWQDRGAEQQGNHRIGQIRRARSGRSASTRARSPGMTPATTGPFCRTRSARPATARRSICWPEASPTPI